MSLSPAVSSPQPPPLSPEQQGERIWICSIFPRPLRKHFPSHAYLLDKPDANGMVIASGARIEMPTGSYDNPSVIEVPPLYPSTVMPVLGGGIDADEQRQGQTFVLASPWKVWVDLKLEWVDNVYRPKDTPAGAPGIGRIVGPEPTREELDGLLAQQNMWFMALVDEGNYQAETGKDPTFIAPKTMARLAAANLMDQKLVQDIPWARGVGGMKQLKQCVACSEEIATEARFCKHCNTNLITYVTQKKGGHSFREVEAIDPFICQVERVTEWVRKEQRAEEVAANAKAAKAANAANKKAQQTGEGFSVADAKIEPMTAEDE